MSDKYPHDWLWAEALELLEEAERLRQQFFHPPGFEAEPAWAPPIDLLETPQAVHLLVALPGVAPEDTQLSIEHGRLVIRARRRLPGLYKQARVRRLEIPYGRFQRQVELPPGRYELDGSEWQYGCLAITLRKVA